MHDEQNEGDEPQPVHEVLLETLEGLDHRLEHGGGAGTPTGLNDLDKLIGGLHPSELLVLAARPSMGKTALASNIAQNVAINCETPTLVVSLEMSGVALTQRMLLSAGRINSAKFRSGFISQKIKGSGVLNLDRRPDTCQFPRMPRRWRQHVQSPQTEAELAALQRSVTRGAPFGEASW